MTVTRPRPVNGVLGSASRQLRSSSEFMKNIVALLVIYCLPLNFIDNFWHITVKTNSMEPTLQLEDNLAVDKGYYSANSIKRFDIVILSMPQVGVLKQSMPIFIVARVVGLGGETISIKKNKVFINGRLLEEPYKKIPCKIDDTDDFMPCSNYSPYKIPEGEYFLLGDNRGNSLDSRLWNSHSVKKEDIVGKVVRIDKKR